MNSNPKTLKVARTNSSDRPEKEEEEDRLSAFPDAILCHILSFLPTKYVATTSVLSTRWKYLFLGVPKIDLVEPLTIGPQEILEGSSKEFINFVNRRLMLCQTSSITEFRLKCRSFPEAPLFNSWLTALLLRNVEVLDIEVQSSTGPPLCPPRGLLLSQTLVFLKLCGTKVVFKKNPPNLKVLHLKDLDMQIESFMMSMEAGVLEDLRLDGIRFRKNEENVHNLLICSRTLKKLAISGVEKKLSRINIDTPHLQHLECECEFEFEDEDEDLINIYKSESLVSADLRISQMARLLNRRGRIWFINILSKISNVKELHFSEGFLESLSPYSLPQFPNLTHLELTASSLSVLIIMLGRAPNLKALVCNMGNSNRNALRKNEPLSSCVAQNLREIRIRNFKETVDEFAFVGCLLLLGAVRAVLEKMIIERPRGTSEEWPSSTLKHLLNLARGSRRCKIQLI